MEDANQRPVLSPQRKMKAAFSSAFGEQGKMPPQALDLEEAVLGAMLLEGSAVNDAIDSLQPESFYKKDHQKIYDAIKYLFNKAEPIDILTVTQELRKRGQLEEVGGAFYISQLTSRVASAANTEFHAKIISQKHIQRELIRVSSGIIKMAYDETTDVIELLDKAESELFAVAEGNIRKNYDSMSGLITQALKQIEEVAKKDGGISGVQSGFAALDKETSGFQPADMVVLAARPGMGKTAFVLSLARNTAVEFNNPIAVFSLEMSSIQLVNRLIASETELSSEKLKKGNLEQHEWEQLQTKVTRLTNAPIFIDDTPALSVFELRAKCRRLKAQHDIKMVIIDYLQLMTAGGNGGNREQEISTISRSIKSIAKELEIPIIALSQLSRSVETRGGSKRPQLSDLRESGAIEQDADMVMFIYRPEYYDITENENGEAYLPGHADLIIAKHRNGSLVDVPLKFIGHLTKFVDQESSGFDNNINPLAPNDDFMNPGGITRLSKMDDIEDDDDVPF